MAKMNPLAQGLESLSKPSLVSAQDQQPVAAKRATSSRTSAREGQILIGGFFAPEVHKQLKVLAAESSQTQQELIAESLNMLFFKYGKPEIAKLGRILKSDKA